MKIPGIYVEIKGDATQLKKEIAQANEYIKTQSAGISNALNNSLSTQKVSGDISKLVSQLGTLNRASTVAGQAFSAVGVDLQALTKNTGLTEQQLGKLQSQLLKTSAASAQENALKRLAASCNLSEKEVRALGTQFNLTAEQMNKVVGASKKAEGSFLSLGNAVRGAAAYFSVMAVAQFAKDAFLAGVQVDSLNRSFVAITGSQQAASKEFDFLRETATRTGQNFYELTDSYRQLIASTRGTSLEGEKTRKIFASISEAAAVLGLSNERVKLSFMAISQMASKGVISMEDLRGQLGESLPGALSMFASAMGVSSGKFQEMVKNGEVLAADLVKLGEALHGTYGKVAETAALESGTAAINRLSESWYSLRANILNSEKIISAINGVGWALKQLSTPTDAQQAGYEGFTIKKIASLEQQKESLLAMSEDSGLTEGQIDKLERTNTELAKYQVYLETIQEKSLKTVLPGSTKKQLVSDKAIEEGNKKLSAYIQTDREKIDAEYANNVKFAQSQEELDKASLAHKKNIDALSKKGATESHKEEREELKQLNAEIKNYVNAGKDAVHSADEWIQKANNSISSMERLHDAYAVDSGMSELAKLTYDTAEAFKDGKVEIDNYQIALARGGVEIASLTAVHKSLSAAVEEYRQKLSENPAGSTEEDLNKLHSLTEERDKASVTLEKATKEQAKLNDLNERGVLTEENLTYAIFESKRAHEARVGALIKDLEASDNFFDNVEAGSIRFAEESSNMGRDISSSISRGFDDATDALATFVTTGKLSFKDMVDSIVYDMARIAIKANVTGPLAGSMSSMMSGESVDDSGSGVSLGTIAGIAKKGYDWIAGPTDTTDTASFLSAFGGSAGSASYASAAAADSSSAWASMGEGAYELTAYESAGDSFAGSAGSSSASTGASAASLWGAGILTAVTTYLQTKDITRSVATGGGAAAGMYAGAAIGSVVPGIGTAIGGAVGAIIGAIGVGSLFGSEKTDHFGIDNAALGNTVPFDAATGFNPSRPVGSTSGETGSWYGPIVNAYSQMVGDIQDNFNTEVFGFAATLPAEMQKQVIDNISIADFGSILNTASAGSWEAKDAETALQGVATKYATSLQQVLANAYGQALAGFIRDKGAAGLLGDSAAWGLLTAEAQANVTAAFNAAAGQISSGDVTGGTATITNITAAIGQIGAAMAPINEIIATNGMSDYELQLRAVNKQFDDYGDSLRAVGVDTEKYTALEEARAIKLKAVINPAVQASIQASIDLLKKLETQANATLTSAEANLKGSFSSEQGRLDTQHQLALDNFETQLDVAKETVSKLTNLTSSIKSSMDSMSLDTDAFVADKRSSAQSSLIDALNSARGGTLDPSIDLSDTLSTLTKSDTSTFTNSEDFQRDYWKTYLSIAELNDLTSDQLTTEESTVSLIEQQISAENTWYESEKDLLTRQLDAVLGLSTITLSIIDAISQYQAAKVSSDTAKADVAAASGSTTAGISSDAYYQLKYAQLSSTGQLGNTFAGIVVNTINDLKEVFRIGGLTTLAHWTSYGASEGLPMPSFAVGTDYVPRNMTANIHEGERITPAAYNRSDKTNSEIVGAIEKMMERIEAQARASAENSLKIAKIVSRWEGDGVLTRVEAA